MARSTIWKRRTGLLLLGLILLALIAWMGLEIWASRWLAKETRAAAAHGSLEITDYLSELEPGERNASHGLAAACHLLLTGPEDQETAPGRGSSFAEASADPALLLRARTWLARPEHRLALEILDLHATTHRARLPYDGPDELSLANHRYFGQRATGALRMRELLRTRVLVAIADRRMDDAYGDAVLLLRLGDWLHTELPSLVSWMVGNALAKTGIQALEELQQFAPPSAEARQLLRETLVPLVERRSSWGLEADRALSHYQVQQGPFEHLLGLAAGWQEKAFQAQWLASYRELIQQANMPVYERPGFSAQLADPSPFMIPSRFLIPNLLDSLDKADAMTMRYQLALLALAWEDARQSDGAYPDDPQTLVPDWLDRLPTDVFTGQALSWQRTADHWLVVSVGINQQNDGGRDRNTPQSGDEDDIAWRLPRAAD